MAKKKTEYVVESSEDGSDGLLKANVWYSLDQNGEFVEQKEDFQGVMK